MACEWLETDCNSSMYCYILSCKQLSISVRAYPVYRMFNRCSNFRLRGHIYTAVPADLRQLSDTWRANSSHRATQSHKRRSSSWRNPFLTRTPGFLVNWLMHVNARILAKKTFCLRKVPCNLAISCHFCFPSAELLSPMPEHLGGIQFWEPLDHDPSLLLDMLVPFNHLAGTKARKVQTYHNHAKICQVNSLY